jgi:hypothetical protein
MLPSPLSNPWLRLAARTSIALIATLAVAVIAAQSSAAPHSPLQTPGLKSPLAAFEEEEAEAEGEAEDWGEEEWEEEVEAEAPPGDECPLRSAKAHASTKHDKLRLTIGYTTNEPFSARITIQRGPVQISSVRRYLGHSGILRLSEKLDEHGGRKIVTSIASADKSAGCPSRRLVLFPR